MFGICADCKSVNIFNRKQIRSKYDGESKEWFFSAVDITAALTESENSRRYWSDLKRRLREDQLYAKIVQLKLCRS
jgi:hypothetical protein